MPHLTRRSFIETTGLAAGALLLASAPMASLAAEGKEKQVGAVEDLMREHGVLRRALLVYQTCAQRLRTDPITVSTEALRKTATLFRKFGEDYHERKLEEAHIFPVVRKVQGIAAQYSDVLIAQHERGRQITDYILSTTHNEIVSTANVQPLAASLQAFVLMYEHHTAREDTIVFTAWKNALSEKALDEMGEQFEAIEHQQFGKDGFEDALKTIAGVEQTLSIEDISLFTAPPPPKG